MSNILGIDVSKAQFDVCLLTADGQSSGCFANTPQGFAQLRRWLANQQVSELHACLEATGRYGQALAGYLVDAGYTVSMVNPKRIAAYAQSKLMRSKTDRKDAQLIADFCRTQQPELWQPFSAQQAERQALSRHLETLKKDHQREQNRLQSGVPSPAVRQAIAEHMGFLERQIQQLEAQLQDMTQQDEDTRQQFQLLVSIPGIGPLTAIKFLAEVPDVTRFDQAGQLAAYAGLVPKVHESGQSHRTGGLSKIGNTFLRTAFYMPALIAMRHNPIIRALADRLEQKGKAKMTIVAAAMRKLLHLAYGVLKTGTPFDCNYCTSQVSA